jgi:predicted dehydrogenase/nucleoside-diphosphate-sugar epimerase
MTEMPDPKSLRIAVVGAGRHAGHHVTAISRCPAATVVGVVDPNAASALELAQLCDARPFRSLAELFSAGSVDVVHIVTPPSTHAALAREALLGGAHLYVEKPFAETSEEAAGILALAEERGRLVCAGHQLLFEPPTRELARRLPSIGVPAHVESYFAFRPVRRAPGGRAPLRADLQLLDILPHPVYLLLDVLGRAAPEGETELAALELSGAGTLHALVRRGGVTGVLTVTLEGRPVESYLRVVGRNGSLSAEYVRGTVQRLVGPGSSGPDKVAAPYRTAWQLGWGSTRALARRLLRRERSYPGLAEVFGEFYGAVRAGASSPISPESILDTVRICERAAIELGRLEARVTAELGQPMPLTGDGVVVTGGTGFLGREVVREVLARGRPVRVLARRFPAPWERVGGAEYAVADLGEALNPDLFEGADSVLHLAAETAGGWADHERNSVAATENVLQAAAAAGVGRVVQVSSVAVLARTTGALGDESPLEPDARGQGPYVWGKLESERRAVDLGNELGLSVKVVRPGALVDYRDFDPPGRLGKRLGPVFIAVGAPGHRLGTTDVRFCAAALAWMVNQWDEAPRTINLLDPESPTKRALLQRLRADNPDLVVVWLPTVLLHPLSWLALGAQKTLRPGRPAIDVAKVFSPQAFDTSSSARLAGSLSRGTTAALSRHP